MSETKKPEDTEVKPEDKELSEEQLEQVAGGALNPFLKITTVDKVDTALKLDTAAFGSGGGAGKV
jgi:hypothetical protein